MTDYATIADMRARYPERRLIELTDDGATGAIDEARVTLALTQAGAEIDGYVAVHYRRADAETPVPTILKDLACEIAFFRLWRNESPPEAIGKSYDRAIAKLRDIAKGVIKIDQGEEVVPERDGMILVQPGRKLFGQDSMTGF